MRRLRYLRENVMVVVYGLYFTFLRTFPVLISVIPVMAAIFLLYFVKKNISQNIAPKKSGCDVFRHIERTSDTCCSVYDADSVSHGWNLLHCFNPQVSQIASPNVTSKIKPTNLQP